MHEIDVITDPNYVTNNSFEHFYSPIRPAAAYTISTYNLHSTFENISNFLMCVLTDRIRKMAQKLPSSSSEIIQICVHFIGPFWFSSHTFTSKNFHAMYWTLFNWSSLSSYFTLFWSLYYIIVRALIACLVVFFSTVLRFLSF